MRPPKRFHELDSMRGLAALSVVALHFVDMNFSPEPAALRTPGEKLTLSLLSPLYSGHSAVVLFFVLSGFVLALPYCRGREQPYLPFLLRRIVRIYLPYLAGLVLAVAGAAFWHGHLGMGAWPEQVWSQPVSRRLVLQHVLFLGDYNYAQFNTVFWSLVVELRVSIVFPVLVFCILRMRFAYSLVLALFFVALSRIPPYIAPMSYLTGQTLLFLPAFVAGILMAQHLQTLEAWFLRLSLPIKWLLLSVSLCGYCTTSLAHGTYTAVLLGAVGLMLFGLASAQASRVLLHRVPLFLGRISFSLYLVHVPVLFALTFMLHRALRPALILPIYLVCALLLAAVFHRLIEAPCIKLSRLVAARSANG